MHLHGAYFHVLSRGSMSDDTVYAAGRARLAVTERMPPLTTMSMAWSPPHAGNWVFHCHLNFHIMPHSPLGGSKASTDKTDEHADHMSHGMGGLVLGARVHGPAIADPHPQRRIRLRVEQYDSVAGEFAPPFSYELDDERKMTIPGPPLVLTRGEPVAITVLNHAKEPTSVHWHGLEIQAYYDGVPGFGGDALRTTPVIAPGDSFTVRITPPRAGTFIYHPHADETRQQDGGLYGGIIVLKPGQKWDPQHDRLIIISTPRDSDNVLINGAAHPTMKMKSGVAYRLRLINITLARPGITVGVVQGNTQFGWKVVARDGADLPPHEVATVDSAMPITIGQTFDAMFTAPAPGTYKFEVRTGAGALLRAADIVVE